MPTKSKSKKASVEIVVLASPVPRVRAGTRNVRGAGNAGSSSSKANVLALASRTDRPRAGPVRMMGRGNCGCHMGRGYHMKGKGVRPSLDSLLINSFGRA